VIFITPIPFKDSDMSNYVTYAIQDTRTDGYVYVGQSKDFENRCKKHLRKGKRRPKISTTNIKTWIYDCLTAGLDPKFITLEIVSTEQESLASETYWVKKLSAEGHQLLNRWDEHRKVIKSVQRKPEKDHVNIAL
jgi:hypothetical protein